MFENLFSEEILTHIQPNPPMAQLQTIFSHPKICCFGEQTNLHVTKTPLQVVIESDKFNTHLSVLQAKQL